MNLKGYGRNQSSDFFPLHLPEGTGKPLNITVGIAGLQAGV
jgi:hypothetical protein